jgi:DNA-binding NarL/FixJ family response regulator
MRNGHVPGPRADDRRVREATAQRASLPADDGQTGAAALCEELRRVAERLEELAAAVGDGRSPQPLDGQLAPPAGRRSAQRDAIRLSGRQQEVLELLAEGCDTDAIARRLWLSRSTVRNHIAAIFRALDAHSRLQAVARARQAGLLR